MGATGPQPLLETQGPRLRGTGTVHVGLRLLLGGAAGGRIGLPRDGAHRGDVLPSRGNAAHSSQLVQKLVHRLPQAVERLPGPTYLRRIYENGQDAGGKRGGRGGCLRTSLAPRQ